YLAYVHVVGHVQHARREIEDAGHTALDQRVGDGLGGVYRGGDDRDRDALRGDHLGQLLGVPDDQPVDPLADPGLVGVEERGDVEAPGAEAGVPGQRVAQVTDADQGDRPVLVEPQHVLDLVGQLRDVVPDPPGTVGAQVGEVLAELRRVD